MPGWSLQWSFFSFNWTSRSHIQAPQIASDNNVYVCCTCFNCHTLPWLCIPLATSQKPTYRSQWAEGYFEFPHGQICALFLLVLSTLCCFMSVEWAAHRPAAKNSAVRHRDTHKELFPGRWGLYLFISYQLIDPDSWLPWLIPSTVVLKYLWRLLLIWSPTTPRYMIWELLPLLYWQTRRNYNKLGTSIVFARKTALFMRGFAKNHLDANWLLARFLRATAPLGNLQAGNNGIFRRFPLYAYRIQPTGDQKSGNISRSFWRSTYYTRLQ